MRELIPPVDPRLLEGDAVPSDPAPGEADIPRWLRRASRGSICRRPRPPQLALIGRIPSTGTIDGRINRRPAVRSGGDSTRRPRQDGASRPRPRGPDDPVATARSTPHLPPMRCGCFARVSVLPRMRPCADGSGSCCSNAPSTTAPSLAHPCPHRRRHSLDARRSAAGRGAERKRRPGGHPTQPELDSIGVFVPERVLGAVRIGITHAQPIANGGAHRQPGDRSDPDPYGGSARKPQRNGGGAGGAPGRTSCSSSVSRRRRTTCAGTASGRSTIPAATNRAARSAGYPRR